jgi:hypothetical protein
VALLWWRVRALVSSADRVLFVAGASAMVVAMVGMSISRSPMLCAAFVVVGSALISVSVFVRGSEVQALFGAAGPVAVTPSRDEVTSPEVHDLRSRGAEARVGARRLAPYRQASAAGEHTKLTSAIHLLVLVVFTTILFSVVVLAVVLGTIFLVFGH